MKKTKFFSCLCVLSVLCFTACNSRQQNTQTETTTLNAEDTVSEDNDSNELQSLEGEFTVVNMTDMEIRNIYISVSNMENWVESLLSKNQVFARGSELTLNQNLLDNEMYDIKCEDKKGKSIIYTELALSNINKIILTVDENGKAYTIVDEKTDTLLGEPESESTTGEEITTYAQ